VRSIFLRYGNRNTKRTRALRQKADIGIRVAKIRMLAYSRELLHYSNRYTTQTRARYNTKLTQGIAYCIWSVVSFHSPISFSLVSDDSQRNVANET